MLKNYVKVALRNFFRQKGYTIINVSGLTVGVACSLLILLWVNDEVSVDRFHANGDNLYKVMRNMYQSEREIITTNAVPQPVKILLDEEYPEVDKVSLVGWDIDFMFQRDKRIFREQGKYVSPEFLEIFSYPLLAGDPKTALDDPTSVLISERLAIKYFGPNWSYGSGIIGETIRIDNRKDFTIQGVFANPPSQSSINFDWLISAQEYIDRNSWVESWYNGGFRMVFTLVPGSDIDQFAKKIEQEVNIHTNNEGNEPLIVQKYGDQYLYGNFENGVNAGGRISYVKIMSIVAVFILVIACINFMNLATARSTHRAKEIGLRKVMGARKGSLGAQFLTESVLISFVSVSLSVLIVYLLLPWFNELTGKGIFIDFSKPMTWIITLGIALLTGVLSGSYPALLLPTFNAIAAMKGTLKHSILSIILRKGLVVFQFAISILLIIGTVTVYKQMRYILSKNLGLDKENLVFVEMEGETSARFDTYKNELLTIPDVKSVTSTSGNPISYGRSSSSPSWRGKDPDMTVEMNILTVSHDFTSTMGMEILSGRDFSPAYGTDTVNFLVNEEAARIMGFENPVGEVLSVWGAEGQIVGLVRDFHMSSMYNPIEPLIVRFGPSDTFLAFLRIQGDPGSALAGIEEVTKDFNPTFPFAYSFLDEEYAQSYRAEMTISTLGNIFSVVAIFISCLGLFGLSSFSTEQRTKEIGIRKVHGATTQRLIVMLSTDFTRLILLAFIIAAPIAYWVSVDWLGQFAFKTSLGAGVFVLSGIVAFTIAALTVSFKSIQVALANPADTLKEE